MPAHSILTADIGGTNCRFALFSCNEALRLERTAWHKTYDLKDLGDVLATCEQSLGLSPREAEVVVLAVAGPVAGSRARTTNADLVLDLEHAGQRHGLHRVRLINDFEAQAYACLTFPGQNAQQIVSGKRDNKPANARKAVLGAGTGLGAASLFRQANGRWIALAAESGHAVFPFVGKEEAAFEAFIRKELGLPYVRGDDVLTGRGLSLLHQFLEGVRREPQDVAKAALQGDSPTLRWFSRFYARTCRNWALTTLCLDGLYIAGGIAAKNPLLVTDPGFAEAFLTSPAYGDLVRSIPVWLMTNENSGLWGAARLGSDILNFPED